MDIKLKPGNYVVAVSGGVDSVVLLDLLYKNSAEGKIVVAHFDHGIRSDSYKDAEFVKGLAAKYGLEFFCKQGQLGAKTGEALARAKRYEFLNEVMERTGSDAVLTAHHQDDLLETIAINLLRGTGRKGLSSLASRQNLIRPLLGFSKSMLVAYAKKQNLKWREDETNTDQKYLRNYIRHSLINKLSGVQKRKLLEIADNAAAHNAQIDDLIEKLFFQKNGLSQKILISLPHDISSEVIADWLRREGARLDKKTVERLVVKLKTAYSGKTIQANKGLVFVVEEGIIRIKNR